MNEIASCPSCGYPIGADYAGQVITCPHCSKNMEISQGVTIPTPLFVGVVCFIAGAIFGPAIAASTERGRAWLTRQARGG